MLARYYRGITSRSFFYKNVWTDRAWIRHKSFLRPTLFIKKVRYLQNWNFVLSTNFDKDERLNVINWTVVGQLS